MTKTLHFAKRNFFALLLLVITAVLVCVNYTPGTWLTGWDTLHPEFNFPLNLTRSFFGVWREEQGLGALAVHSHMADLPRILLLWLVSPVFPTELLRYFYIALMLVIGPLGAYYYLEYTIQKRLAAFLGGLFYLLNLGTLQNFHVPFEMFTVQFGFLPWLFLFAIKYYKTGFAKYLLGFSIATLLSSPMAYAATLWYAYFLGLAVYLLVFSRAFQKVFILKRVLVILATTLALNTYWLLPNLYLAANSGSRVSEAKINQMFSENAFLHDKDYANIFDTLQLRGFLFNWNQFTDGELLPLLNQWQEHLGNPFIGIVGILLSTVVILGITQSIKEKKAFSCATLSLAFFALIFLLHDLPILDQIFAFLRAQSNLMKEGLRFPWTKFSIIAMFAFSFFFAKGFTNFTHSLKTRSRNLLAVLLSLALFIWMLPAFSGGFISSTVRDQEIPKEYFQMYDWFQEREMGRTALLPMPTFQGWEYYKWGFEGAGFMWFGSSQPILTRDFDRWQSSNENFYWELSYAIYSENQSRLEKTLEKYQVEWLVVDKNMTHPIWTHSLYIRETESLLENSEKVHLKEEFGNIKIYKVSLTEQPESLIVGFNNLPNIGPTYKWGNLDYAFSEYGYYASTKSVPQIYYPFRSLFSNKEQEDIEFSLVEESDSFVFQKQLPQNLKNHILDLPELEPESFAWINPDDPGEIKYLMPDVQVNGDLLEVSIPKAGGYLSAEINPLEGSDVGQAQKCGPGAGEVKNTIVENENSALLRLKALRSNNCSATFILPNLPHDVGYLITAESRNVQNKPITFWVENLTVRHPDLETNLPKSKNLRRNYFIQPPMEPFGTGYTLHFDNVGIGDTESINDLGRITINPIPYNFLVGIRLIDSQFNSSSATTVDIEVSHPNPAYYDVHFQKKDATTLFLSQSFDKGWQAYEVDKNMPGILAPILGTRLEDHFLVNNWANGWIVNESQERVVIFYLPQLLQFVGFALLLIPVAILVKKR